MEKYRAVVVADSVCFFDEERRRNSKLAIRDIDVSRRGSCDLAKAGNCRVSIKLKYSSMVDKVHSTSTHLRIFSTETYTTLLSFSSRVPAAPRFILSNDCMPVYHLCEVALNYA